MTSPFIFQLVYERSLRRNRPYGGQPRLPSEGSPQMAFFDAAAEGDLPRLRELASGRDAEGMAWLADVCIVGGGPIQTAARMGKLDAVRCMVEELGFDVNASSQAGVTSLTTAAIDERMDVMRYLLDQGADPKKPDDSGHFPLHLAAKYGLFCANTKLSVFRLAFTSWLLRKEDLKEWFIVLLNSLQLLTNAI